MPDVKRTEILARVSRIRRLMDSWGGGRGIKFLPRAGKEEGEKNIGRSIKMHERKKRLNGARVYGTISNYANKRGSLFIENYPFIE